VPLPERLYAGGAASHRGFPSNGAGPRDLQTGYPVGGTGAFVNTTEFRFPGPTLPLVGNSIDLVLFHDMGNVFTKIGDIWPSFGRVTQPDSQTCSMLTDASGNPLTQGVCNFNYFSHAVGAGLRYKTPIGPIRLDFSYNLNPPVYPVIDDYNAYPLPPPYVGQAAHFNFFFSIGQSF
jgi:outer membrane protein assembly factor BamA